MEILDFYTNLIELAWPWTVKSVAANEGPESVDVYLVCAEDARFACPHCSLPALRVIIRPHRAGGISIHAGK